jgi:LytR cell envelope-related transcriptional attenuator
VQARGWQVAQVGNFAGLLPATTVYYSPGNAGEEAAARELAREFPQVSQVLPRYAGLPPTPAGIVLVVTKDWS